MLLIEKEKRDSNFIELPDYFFELLHYFKTHEIESLLCELKRIRRNKVWQGLRILDGRGLCINGITRWEFNEFREFILGSLEFGKKIEGD